MLDVHQLAEGEHAPCVRCVSDDSRPRLERRRRRPARRRRRRPASASTHLGLLLAGGRVRRPARVRVAVAGGARLPPIQCSMVLMRGPSRCRSGAQVAALARPCAASYAVRACWVESSAETSATGTSHQAGLSGAGTSGSVSTWTTVVRVGRAAPRASAVSELVDACDADDVGAEARGVGGEVDRQTSPSRPVVGAVAVAGAEPLRAERLRQRADRGEAVVLHQHDDQLEPSCDRGDELLRHHQVRAVADHDEHVAVVAGRQRPS